MPRFSIISGGRGAGKLKIARYMAKRMESAFIICGIKVSDVREVITMAHKLATPTIYVFPRADQMSPAARNSLLKVTEEAPRKARFIMTVYDINQVMPTLRSRGTHYPLDPYTPDELIQYANVKISATTLLEDSIIVSVCETPGDVERLFMQGSPEDFYSYVNLVFDNIGNASPANALKISSKIAYKPEDSGWDYILFMRGFMASCRAALGNPWDSLVIYEAIRNTTGFLSRMQINGVNKSAVFDLWLLDMMGVFFNDPTQ